MCSCAILSSTKQRQDTLAQPQYKIQSYHVQKGDGVTQKSAITLLSPMESDNDSRHQKA